MLLRVCWWNSPWIPIRLLSCLGYAGSRDLSGPFTNRGRRVLCWLRRFEGPVRAVYESGPTGFVLARYLQESGIDCVIAASSKLLRAPGDRVKTDRRDARILAQMLAVGSVTEVRIPDLEQESLRDLSRLRAAAAKDLAHSRQRINALLLRHGIRYVQRPRWTQLHTNWLHAQHFNEADLQFTYEADVELSELLAARLRRIDQRVEKTAQNCQYTPVINALMCLRGIKTTTGFGLAVEIGDWTRFTGANIGSYLGLVPSEQSSGPSRHQGPITKAGNSYGRKLLIEAAWVHRRPYARPGLRLQRQLDLVDPATRIRALEGNHRLYERSTKLEARKKLSVTTNTAIARELASWCWSLAAPIQRGGHMTNA
ncbi:MAG: IS110 family transposase [Specibacter sp.]